MREILLSKLATHVIMLPYIEDYHFNVDLCTVLSMFDVQNLTCLLAQAVATYCQASYSSTSPPELLHMRQTGLLLPTSSACSGCIW